MGTKAKAGYSQGGALLFPSISLASGREVSPSFLEVVNSEQPKSPRSWHSRSACGQFGYVLLTLDQAYSIEERERDLR